METHSPPIFHLPAGTITTYGHYILLGGKISSNSYYTVDPTTSWNGGTLTISGSRWSYQGASGSIENVIQYYNPNASIPPQTAELDVNGVLDGNISGNVAGYATFDMYINGSKVSDDVNDFCRSVNIGSTYEIKDIKVASGKALEGYAGATRSGYVGGGRTGTVNSNTDVPLKLHTVDAAGYVNGHSPSIVSTYNGHAGITDP